MRRLTTLFAILMIYVSTLFAQAPNKFSYQAVVRNTSNQLVVNTLVGIRVSILQNSATGSVVYSETQMLSTNANGLVTMNIGEGTVIYGSLNNIDWSAGIFFLKSEIDPTGGSNYTISSTQQLLSVPYALYANEAGNSFSGDYNDLTNKPTIPTVPTNVSAFTNDAGYISGYTETDPVFSAWDKNYNDLTNKPTIPAAANNATLTIQRNNSTVGTFTADASSDKTVNISVPTTTSELTNNSGYITADQLDALLNAMNSRMDSLQTVLSAQNVEIASLSNTVDSLGAYADSLGNIVDECGCLSTFHCGTSTISDYDGNAYSTVKLGGQCWMAENLRTTHYSNGDPIDLSTTTSTTIPYRYNPASDSTNVGTYGYLYNWAAVMNGATSSEANPSGVQGVCPTGWHVPSDAEWTAMKEYVSSQSQYICGSNSSNIGKALASTTGWDSSTSTACGVGTTQSTNNAAGFNARPAGNYYASGGNGFGYYANFWTTTETSGNAYSYNLSYTSPSLNRSSSGKASGFSVRCVRD